MSVKVEIPGLKPCPFCGTKAMLVVNSGTCDMRLFTDDRDINNRRYYLRQTIKIECEKCLIRTGEWTAEVEVDPKTMQTRATMLETNSAKKIIEKWNGRVGDCKKEGQWMESKIPDEKYVCSVCGGACWYYDYQRELGKSRYCPSCGAKMERGEQE